MNVPEIEERTRSFLAALDREIGRKLAGLPVSCSTGCAHCCYMLAECGIAEGLYIAAEVARWPDWREVARALAEHAVAQVQATDGAWTPVKEAWFDLHVPCPFLVGGNLCRVYERRPVACRSHFVRTPAENCALGAADPHTERYGIGEQAVPHVQRLDAGIFRDYAADLGGSFVGMLSHLVLFALRYVVSGGDRRWLDKRLAKLPHPREWTARRVRAQLAAMNSGLKRSAT